MPKPFHKLTLQQFAGLLNVFPFQRRINAVHMHHTWRPNHADFTAREPIESIEGMWRFHTEVNGWSDIAQHITIDPNGDIWTGRDWNRAPASATGHNGNSDAGPFMFETIGDFDLGGDVFGGAQKAAALGVIAHVQQRFGLPAESLAFHNQMGPKTCPGSQFNYAAFLEEVRAESRQLPVPAPATIGETREAVTQILTMMAPVSRGIMADEGELAENTMTPEQAAFLRGDRVAASRGPLAQARGERILTPQEIDTLRPYVVDLRMGAFSTDGQFTTSAEDVDRIFGEELPRELAIRKANGQKLQLMFYAHGGLVDEIGGLAPILQRLDFWRKNGVYPIFFVWETGLKETVFDIIKNLFGARALSIPNPVLEALARQGGLAVWNNMKRSAELASLPTGGALYVAGKTRAFWQDHHEDMQMHATGHSAGAIFHSDFLPVLLDTRGVEQKLHLETMHFLAPACSVDLFKLKLIDMIGDGKPIRKFTMYTMRKALEMADTAGPYHGSLLYLVSRAFEPVQPTPILGLEESIRRDPALLRLFGLAGIQGPRADILFSTTAPDASPRSATESTSHGDFDNDVKTMNSVIRRTLDLADSTPISSFVDESGTGRGLFPELAGPPPPEPAAPPERPARPTPVTTQPPVTEPPAASGNRRAVCVGNDAYPAPDTLGGCVNDARTWSATLSGLGFEVTTLENADRATIVSAMEKLLGDSQAGDVAVFQYSGHGTQVEDLNGDEPDDGLDEAICPVDFAQGRLVIDDDIRAIVGRLSAGVNLTFFMDCCHSGTISRMVAGISAANLGAPNTVKRRFIPFRASVNEAHKRFRDENPTPATAPRGIEEMKEVLFSACLDNEVAFERDGAGDFTTRATMLLRAGIGNMTNADFEQQVLAAFGTPPPQSPHLDCAPESESLPLLQPRAKSFAAAGGR